MTPSPEDEALVHDLVVLDRELRAPRHSGGEP